MDLILEEEKKNTFIQKPILNNMSRETSGVCCMYDTFQLD